ncbi:hypothetical protein RND81_11G148200 [Saponaria officinalis]|uniref:Uncharacterized protein n=1 Tax=Saponaria officinalis TaxID=3572 RepID=A0AAW1HM61_SAPOF
MAVTLEELFKASPRREIRSSKGKNKKVIRNKTLLENIVKNGDISSRISEDGTLKMKILVKKQDLKQMLETVDVVSNNNNNCTSTCTSISISISTSTSRALATIIMTFDQSLNIMQSTTLELTPAHSNITKTTKPKIDFPQN